MVERSETSRSAEPHPAQAAGSDPERRPFYKNPWIIGWLIGAALITLIRPCTRYIPDPPPDFGAADYLSSQRDTRRGATLIQILPSPCAATCLVALDRVATLEGRAVRERKEPIAIVTLTTGDEAELERLRRHVNIEASETWTMRRADLPEGSLPAAFADAGHAADLTLRNWSDLVDDSLLWIVDQNSRLRGVYPLADGEGLDEAYHRAQHVIDGLSAPEGRDG